MVYQRVAQYLWLKGNIYYFNRRVPKDIQGYYKSSRIVICLKTTRQDTAARSAKSIAQRLEDYWMSLRLANIDVPALHLLRDRPLKLSQSSCMTLTAALELYLRLRGVNKGKVFRRGAERNIQSVVDVLSDRPLDEYSSSDAAAYGDYLLKRGLTTNSVKRNFANIRSVINLATQEHGLECRNAFSKVYLHDLDDAKKRKPVPIENIKEIQQECMSIDDEARWLVALISDTGMRLSKAAGLHIDDIKLDCEVPHIDLKHHAWRGLKTRSSQRQIPPVGASLWAAKRVKANNTASPYAFPRHTSAKGTNANSASAAINKWLKPRVPEGCVIHSFRHSIRDRLRAVQCPSDMVDQMGGWSTAGVGQCYGEGYGLTSTVNTLCKISKASN
jgi:integrase